MQGLLLGWALGLLELIPNAHPTILAVSLLPALKLDLTNSLIAIFTLFTVSTHLKALTHTFHPIPKALMGSAEPAQRLAYKGEGLKALNIQLQYGAIGLVGPVLWLPLASLFLSHAAPAAPVVAGLLLVFTVARCKSRLGALLVCGLAGFVGLLAENSLQHEGTIPLLTGLFTLPPLLATLNEGKLEPLPVQRGATPYTPSKRQELDISVGMLSAFLPGISVSSLTHLTMEDQSNPEDYLCANSTQDWAAGTCALLLLLYGGGAHSGLAIALKNMASDRPSTFCILVASLTLLLTLPTAKALTNKLAIPYQTIINKLPGKLFATIMLPVSLYLSFQHGGLYALLLVGAAASVSWLQKTLHMPNQTLLQALTMPMIVHGLI